MRYFLLVIISVCLSTSLLAAPNEFTDLNRTEALVKTISSKLHSRDINLSMIGQAIQNDGEVYEAYRRLYYQVSSWAFFFNANKNNPLMTTHLSKYLETNSSCKTRIMMELLEEQLRTFSNDDQRMALIYKIANNTFFKKLYHTKFYNTADGYVDMFKGTSVKPSDYEPYEIIEYNEILERFADSLDVISHDWRDDDEVEFYTKRIFETISEAKKCTTPINTKNMFFWVDYEEVIYIVNSEDRIEQNLKNFFMTSYFPDIPEHSPYALALHPRLGLKLANDEIKLSKELFKSFWKIVPELAYEDGYVTKDTCKAIMGPLFFGATFGMSIDGVKDINEKFITKKIFKEWMTLRGTLAIAEYEQIPHCGAAARFMDIIWPTSKEVPAPYQGHTRFSGAYKTRSLDLNLDYMLDSDWQLELNLDAKVYEGAKIKKGKIN